MMCRAFRSPGVAGPVALLSTLVLTGSCSPDEASTEDGTDTSGEGTPTLAGPPASVSSPAGEGSGEPHLSSGEDELLLSWLEPTDGDRWTLRAARWDRTGWGEARTVTSSARFFVNWADFPSVVPAGDALYAHWLERGDQGGYDYGVRVVRSSDDGATWSEAWTPHSDGTPTEHGFVSTFAHPDGGAGVVWLDGRRFVAGPGGEPATEEMTLRTRRIGADGPTGETVLLDGRVCDCCQTDAAMTSSGPLVVYRDRDENEIRDIYITRLVDGRWTEGRSVHDDGWHIAACPVNGPAATADGDRVAVAWFTAARDTAAVKVAFSDDAGATFDAPIRIDGGRPAGRVDVVGLEDGSVIVSWIERTGEGGAELRVRRVHPDGRAHPSTAVSRTSAARASGFPQMVLHDGALFFAWTDVPEDGERSVQTARVTMVEGS